MNDKQLPFMTLCSHAPTGKSNVGQKSAGFTGMIEGSHGELVLHSSLATSGISYVAKNAQIYRLCHPHGMPGGKKVPDLQLSSCSPDESKTPLSF